MARTPIQIRDLSDTFAASSQPFIDHSALISVPFTTITNRAKIPDITNDLKTSMGIDRVCLQSIYKISSEYGPNGEPVFGALNDPNNLVRFVGQWAPFLDAQGSYISTVVQNDYLEITFFGTGLNLLFLAGAYARDWRVSVDGGATGANIYPGSATSGVLTGRNYSDNTVLKVVSGLTLGIHTVKIINNTTQALILHGYEVLNVSANVNVNSGNAYLAGIKDHLAAASLTSYNSGFTNVYGTAGAKGSRVLVYLLDGNIKKDIQYTNVSALTLSSADHTNEEEVRTYFPREFGAGRADDFSLVSNGAALSDAAFTLDDGTATLTGQGTIEIGFNGISGVPEGLSTSTNGGFIIFTFVGTGLDLVLNDNGTGGSDTHNFQIDGGSTVAWPYTAGSTVVRRLKIVSGLPYGTHTFKLNRVTAATWTPSIISFIVYQPKTPALSSGAIALGAYNIMAGYVANTTADILHIGTGVLRKQNTREWIYVNGTGGTADFIVASASGNYISGFETYSNRANAYVEYTFFGTGFEFRFDADVAAGTTDARFTLNGTSLITANFGTAVFSVYGTGVTYDSTTNGSLDTSGSNTLGSGLTVSSLPLGLYTLRITNNVASKYVFHASLDIITPIHSLKFNGPGLLQNTLSIGSQGIEDLRGSPVLSQDTWAQAFAITSDPTTTAVAPIPMPDMSITLPTFGKPIEIFYSWVFTASSTNAGVSQIYVDGVSQGSLKVVASSAGPIMALNDLIIVPVGAGIHKIELFWWTNSGTITADQKLRNMRVREISNA